MEQPKSQTAFDPNRTPFTSPAARFTYINHPTAGLMKVNSDTKQIVPVDGQRYPGMPLKLIPELMAVPQPHVRTCGKSGDEVGLGCLSATNGGCPILTQYGRVGPVNLILEKNGKVDSAPCHTTYCGMSAHGRPMSQVHYLIDGWQILTDRTTIPENVRDPITRKESVRQTEVPDLAPFYDHLKVAKPEKKKRGRPKKVQVATTD
jgi:hypothetical protein